MKQKETKQLNSIDTAIRQYYTEEINKYKQRKR